MTTFAYSTLDWSPNLFAPGIVEELAPRPASHRADPMMRRRSLPTPTTPPPGSEPDRSQEDDERWDGLS